MIRNRPGAKSPALPQRVRIRPLALAVLTLLAGTSLPVLAQSDNAATPSSPPQAHKKASGAAASSAAGDDRSATSYSIGLLMGAQLHQSGVGSGALSYEQFMKGFRAALAGTGKPVPQDSQRAMTFLQREHEQFLAKNAQEAERFLARNGKQPGVQTTASGLEYKVLKPGSGASPKVTDEVTVNYRGTLPDGQEFDSSYKRGQPAKIPLGNVIKGWQEALLMMKPGAEYEIWMPPNIGYGDHPPPGSGIPPNSLLKFDVTLISAQPAPAGPTLSSPVPSPRNLHPGAAVPGGPPGGASPAH